MATLLGRLCRNTVCVFTLVLGDGERRGQEASNQEKPDTEYRYGTCLPRPRTTFGCAAVCFVSRVLLVVCDVLILLVAEEMGWVS